MYEMTHTNKQHHNDDLEVKIGCNDIDGYRFKLMKQGDVMITERTYSLKRMFQTDDCIFYVENLPNSDWASFQLNQSKQFCHEYYVPKRKEHEDSIDILIKYPIFDKEMRGSDIFYTKRNLQLALTFLEDDLLIDVFHYSKQVKEHVVSTTTNQLGIFENKESFCITIPFLKFVNNEKEIKMTLLKMILANLDVIQKNARNIKRSNKTFDTFTTCSKQEMIQLIESARIDSLYKQIICEQCKHISREVLQAKKEKRVCAACFLNDDR